MQWISDIFKYITISRTLTVATFVTTATLLFGHHLYPNLIDSVPPKWNWILVAAFIFTSVLLSIWLMAFFWHVAKSMLRFVAHHPLISTPSQSEIQLLEFMGVVRNQSLNLADLSVNNEQFSMAQLLDWSDRLQKRGLVEANPYSESLITLTPRGRKYVLKRLNIRSK